MTDRNGERVSEGTTYRQGVQGYVEATQDRIICGAGCVVAPRASWKPGRGKLGCQGLRGGWWWEGWKKRPRVKTTLSTQLNCEVEETEDRPTMGVLCGRGETGPRVDCYFVSPFKKEGWNKHEFVLSLGVRGAGEPSRKVKD